MFLDNWYKLLKVFHDNYNKTSAETTIIDYSGASVTDSLLYNLSSSAYYAFQHSAITNYSTLPSLYLLSNNDRIFYGTSNTSGGSYAGVILGDGDTAVASSDHSLSGNIITAFTATTAVSSAYADGKLIFTGTYNITNTGADSIIVKEIGLSKKNYATSSRTLLARSVLETPVTIAPGDTGVVTYKIEIS